MDDYNIFAKTFLAANRNVKRFDTMVVMKRGTATVTRAELMRAVMEG